MSAEAILLGTAQDGGVPQAGCDCSHCAAARADPAARHWVACLGLVDRAAGQSWLIDARRSEIPPSPPPNTPQSPWWSMKSLPTKNANTTMFGASLEASMEGMYRGAFDYLLKPVSIDELVYKIEDAYRRKQLNESSADAGRD